MFAADAIEVIRIPVQAPQANAICERVVGTLRRECLDRLLIIGHRQLEAVLSEYLAHYNGHRPHRSLNQCPPDGRVKARLAGTGAPVVRRDRLGGIVHEYELAA